MSRSVSDFILSAGGFNNVAARAGVGHWAVRKWRQNGIPDAHWPIFVEAGIATPDELYEANKRLRALAPLAAGRPAHA